MAHNFSIRLEEYLENSTWEDGAILWQMRLTRTSVYTASTQTVTHTPAWPGSPTRSLDRSLTVPDGNVA